MVVKLKRYYRMKEKYEMYNFIWRIPSSRIQLFDVYIYIFLKSWKLQYQMQRKRNY